MSLNEFLGDSSQQTQILLSTWNFDLILLQPLVLGRMRWTHFQRLVRFPMLLSNLVCADVGLTNSWQRLEGMTIGETAEAGGMIFYPIGVRLPHSSPHSVN
jgi:hypothetical protein